MKKKTLKALILSLLSLVAIANTKADICNQSYKGSIDAIEAKGVLDLYTEYAMTFHGHGFINSTSRDVLNDFNTHFNKLIFDNFNIEVGSVLSIKDLASGLIEERIDGNKIRISFNESIKKLYIPALDHLDGVNLSLVIEFKNIQGVNVSSKHVGYAYINLMKDGSFIHKKNSIMKSRDALGRVLKQTAVCTYGIEIEQGLRNKPSPRRAGTLNIKIQNLVDGENYTVLFKKYSFYTNRFPSNILRKEIKIK